MERTCLGIRLGALLSHAVLSKVQRERILDNDNEGHHIRGLLPLSGQMSGCYYRHAELGRRLWIRLEVQFENRNTNFLDASIRVSSHEYHGRRAEHNHDRSKCGINKAAEHGSDDDIGRIYNGHHELEPASFHWRGQLCYSGCNPSGDGVPHLALSFLSKITLAVNLGCCHGRSGLVVSLWGSGG